jgi:muconolactone delta-isomerase
MLYHVVLYMNRQALVAEGEAIAQVLSAEVQRARSAQEAGRLIGLWRRADGNGVILILDSESHEALHEELRTLPLFPFVRSIDVIPLLSYPGFPEFAEARVMAA